jgi:hypothetical protein
MPARKKAEAQAEPQALLMAQGYSQITGLAAAKGLAQGSSGSIPAGVTMALVQCEAQPIRWRDDGTPPTATLGFLMNPGDVMTFDQRLDQLKFIEAAAGAKVNVSFYKSI